MQVLFNSAACALASKDIQSKHSKLNKENSVVSVPNYKNFSVPALKAFYCPEISFGRRLEEHKRNGAYVDKHGNVYMKLFTFPDVKSVTVDIKNKGEYELQKSKNGIFETKLLPSQAQDGDKYSFKIQRGNGSIIKCKDPYAMKQENILDEYSTIYDHNKFKWTDDEWVNGTVPQKVSRRSQHNGLRSLNDLKITEVNIATLTKNGDFESAKSYIDKVSQDGIFNTIELMPVENTFSYNWGYDGVDKFAPQSSLLGGPDALKDFVNYAHEKKLNVIMDVVPNHVGTDGNFLDSIGPYLIKDKNVPWGSLFNVECDPDNNGYVRDYLSNSCLNWLSNYHCDGLRLDMTKFVKSDFTLKQIAMEVHYHHPDAVLIAEDASENRSELTRPLSESEECIGKSEDDHSRQIDLVSANKASVSNIGFDSEWDFPYFHALNDTVTFEYALSKSDKENEQYKNYRSGRIYSLNDLIKTSGSRVKYSMSHDEIGNVDGTRLISKLATSCLDMKSKINDANNPAQAAHSTQAVLVSYAKGQYSAFTDQERKEFLNKNSIVKDIKPEEVESAVNYAFAQNKVSLGNVFVTPGPKMVFQGDEDANLSYFKFFRQFSPGEVQKDEAMLRREKGYEPGFKAFMDSKLNNIDYSYEYKLKMQKMKNYVHDLSVLSSNNKALRDGYVVDSVVHQLSQLNAVHLKKDEQEVFTISNFKNISYDKNYGITFPKGKWKEVLNSNSTKYGGDGSSMNTNDVSSNGLDSVNVSVPSNSLLVFVKTA